MFVIIIVNNMIIIININNNNDSKVKLLNFAIYIILIKNDHSTPYEKPFLPLWWKKVNMYLLI